MRSRPRIGKLTVFNTVSLDGFFTDSQGEMGFAHAGDDAEWNQFVTGNASGEGTLLFGRTTYELMQSFWPTAMAKKAMPEVAARMNSARKIVFSKKLKTARWNNTRVARDLLGEIGKLKSAGEEMTLLGSGSIVSQLAAAGLIDELTLVLAPVAIGQGRSMFASVTQPLKFKRKAARSFKNGNVVISYQPA